MHGKGKLYWPDGKIYTGDFLEDKRHGLGHFIWKDGKEYRGAW
jgi:hypothetical protein